MFRYKIVTGAGASVVMTLALILALGEVDRSLVIKLIKRA